MKKERSKVGVGQFRGRSLYQLTNVHSSVIKGSDDTVGAGILSTHKACN